MNATASTSGVGCTDCPMQSSCLSLLSPAAACGYLRDSCSCALSTRGCRWVELDRTCVPRGTGTTSCSACARQASCDPPQVTQVLPLRGPLLGSSAARSISVTFNRAIKLAGKGDVSFHCAGSSSPLIVPKPSVSVTGSVLSIDAARVTNPSTLTCNLGIDDNLVQDSGNIWFLGMSAGRTGSYVFELADTVPPGHTSLEPADGAKDVALNAVAIITFSENVVKSTTFAAELVALGMGGQSSAADRTVARFDSLSAGVAVSGNRMTVDLDGHAEAGVSYAIVVPAGALQDGMQNPYPGLPKGSYVFTTVIQSIVINSSEDRSTVWIIIAVASFVFLVCVGCLILYCVSYRVTAAHHRLREKRRFSLGSRGLPSRVSDIARSISLTRIHSYGNSTSPERSEAYRSESYKVHPAPDASDRHELQG